MRIQNALSEWLLSLGFHQMAVDVEKENDFDRLRKYARIILKNAPPQYKQVIRRDFALLRLL